MSHEIDTFGRHCQPYSVYCEPNFHVLTRRVQGLLKRLDIDVVVELVRVAFEPIRLQGIDDLNEEIARLSRIVDWWGVHLNTLGVG